jgi:hypothetical protein
MIEHKLRDSMYESWVEVATEFAAEDVTLRLKNEGGDEVDSLSSPANQDDVVLVRVACLHH